MKNLYIGQQVKFISYDHDSEEMIFNGKITFIGDDAKIHIATVELFGQIRIIDRHKIITNSSRDDTAHKPAE